MSKPMEINDLIAEAESELGLEPADAARMLFVALAKQWGWTNAGISRYLGVSRARIGQKVGRNTFYLKEYKLPKLKKTLKAIGKKKSRGEDSRMIGFRPDDWQDAGFAEGLLKLVMPVEGK